MSKKRRENQNGSHQHKRNGRDEHHLLFPKADWGRSPFGRRLRAHRYFRRYIPEDTLHRKIHRNITVIPLPPEQACKEAYYELLRRCKCNLVDPYHDPMERRLQLLIDLWHDYPKTVRALEKQQKIAIEFYENGRL